MDAGSATVLGFTFISTVIPGLVPGMTAKITSRITYPLLASAAWAAARRAIGTR